MNIYNPPVFAQNFTALGQLEGSGVKAVSYLQTLGYIAMTPVAAQPSVEGNLYYDSTAHKLKIRGAVGFETVSSA